MSFFGRSQIYNSDPVEGEPKECWRCPLLQEEVYELREQIKEHKKETDDLIQQVNHWQTEWENSSTENLELAKLNSANEDAIEELKTTIKNIKPREIVVPAGEINERLYDIMRDMIHFYEIGSRGLEPAIRNDKFASKMNNIKQYLTSIKRAED